MDLFEGAKKLSRWQYREIAAFCGGVALLLLVAGFIAGGGTARVGQSVDVRGISPSSQTASLFPCSWFGNCGGGGAATNSLDFYASPVSVMLGQPTTLYWSASRGGVPLCLGPGASGRTAAYHCYINGVEVYNGTNSGTYTVTPSAGTTVYSFCTAVVQYLGGSCLTATVTAIAPPPPPPPVPSPTVIIDAGAGDGVTRTVTVGTPVTITGTFTPGSGDTITRTSLVDYQSNALPGISVAVPPTTKSYVFTPTAAGSYIFYPSVVTATYPSWNNYGKSVTVNVTQPVLGPCNDIPPALTVPNGCVNPAPAPGICTPSGGSYSAPSNSCSCPAGTHLSGSTCVANPLCSNGLNDSYAPSCTCPAGKYQPLGASSCVALPICTNGLSQAYSPSCTCPSGQVQVKGGSTCVAQGVINTLTVNPSRVLKGNTATVSWTTANMASCTLSGLDANGSSNLSSVLSGSLTPTITSKTVFTLTCADASGASYSASATVNLIPQTIEQ